METYRKINPDIFIIEPKLTSFSKPLPPSVPLLTIQEKNTPAPPSQIQAKNFINNLKTITESNSETECLSNGNCVRTPDNSQVPFKEIGNTVPKKPLFGGQGVNIPKKMEENNYITAEELSKNSKSCPVVDNNKEFSRQISDPNEKAKSALKTKETNLTNETPQVRKIPNKVHWRMNPNLVKHEGGCHCGAVRFEVYAPESPNVIECNCSICIKKQNNHFIVPECQFKLRKGHDSLTTYTFNTHKAKHTFCSTCGVQSFYIPRSNSDGYGIAIHCLDEGTYKKAKPEKFDGKNWETEIEKKPHIKKYSKVF